MFDANSCIVPYETADTKIGSISIAAPEMLISCIWNFGSDEVFHFSLFCCKKKIELRWRHMNCCWIRFLQLSTLL